jgi:divalent metal cation (Fe/Co/Zn/Cd) transporter
LASVVFSIGLTASQVFAGIVSGSQGLIANGLHSLTDMIADFVVLFTNHHSGKEADDDHHDGHQRYETAASLILGGSLLKQGLHRSFSY